MEHQRNLCISEPWKIKTYSTVLILSKASVTCCINRGQLQSFIENLAMKTMSILFPKTESFLKTEYAECLKRLFIRFLQTAFPSFFVTVYPNLQHPDVPLCTKYCTMTSLSLIHWPRFFVLKKSFLFLIENLRENI